MFEKLIKLKDYSQKNTITPQNMSDSEYEYESESESIYDDHEYEMTRGKSSIPYSFDNVPEDIKQYQWSVMCMQMREYFMECTYDLSNNLDVTFTCDSKRIILSVVNTDNKDEWFPYIPPTIRYDGPSINIEDLFSITNHWALNKNKWNICTDMFAFITKALEILERAPIIEKDIIYDTIISISTKMYIPSGFQFSDLPAFGITLQNATSKSSFSWTGSVVSDTLSSKLCKEIKQLAKNVDVVQQNPSYNLIVKQVINMIMDATFSKLEIVMNEMFYTNIRKIIQKLNFDFDISKIETHKEESRQSKKVFFVDTFTAHSFANRNADTLLPKFTKRVMAEIELLHDALEDFEGYIAVSETNIRLLKLLLIPDYDTPYGGGYFEFDIFIPGDYPSSPPNIQFTTTGNGKVRFNPNLYNSGKVCLSILNTWATNQWDPKISTLTQVILSIRSMIFIDHPYTNEPAYYNAIESESGRKASERYNKEIRQYTIDVAIKKQIENSKSIFFDIIQKHWNQNKDKTIEAYAKYDLTI